VSRAATRLFALRRCRAALRGVAQLAPIAGNRVRFLGARPAAPGDGKNVSLARFRSRSALRAPGFQAAGLRFPILPGHDFAESGLSHVDLRLWCAAIRSSRSQVRWAQVRWIRGHWARPPRPARPASMEHAMDHPWDTHPLTTYLRAHTLGHTHWVAHTGGYTLGGTGGDAELGRRVPAPEQSATDNARIAEVFPRPSQYRGARCPMRSAAARAARPPRTPRWAF
jgi:hypothetical protein